MIKRIKYLFICCIFIFVAITGTISSDFLFVKKEDNVPCVHMGIGYSKIEIERAFDLKKSDSEPNYYYLEAPCENINRIVYKFKRNIVIERVYSVTAKFQDIVNTL